LTIVLPVPPSLNRYWRNIRGRVVLSSEGKAYKRKVEDLFAEATNVGKTVRGVPKAPVKLWVDIYRPRKSGDLDNYLKALLDSLNGLAYEDDRQIIMITARRFDDKDNPRAEVRLEYGLENG
jgi:crossover junction endodeoxyribonuclease RusA